MGDEKMDGSYHHNFSVPDPVGGAAEGCRGAKGLLDVLLG